MLVLPSKGGFRKFFLVFKPSCMKAFVQYFAIAMLSSICTFFLFRNVELSEANGFTLAASNGLLVSDNKPATPVNTKPRDWSNNILPDFVSVAKEITNTVVTVATLGNTGYRMSSGSGVIISQDGFIITNYHVIEEGERFEVTLPNKRTLSARLIGMDSGTDLAVLKVATENLRPLTIGNSDEVQIGEWVLAIGNPFDLSSTITAGIVSAKARNINILEDSYSIESFIQTDAVVNPGNSGGALVNMQGELIGINTAIISESGGYEGYSFAIPSNLVRKVVKDIQEFGKVQRAILGVNIKDVDNKLATALKLPGVEGVYVSNVTKGSSAYEAGLRAGDVIVSVNSIKIASVPELQEQVAMLRPGDRVGIDFFREGKKYRCDNIVLKSFEAEASYR